MRSVTISQTFRAGNVSDAQFIEALAEGNKKDLSTAEVAQKLGMTKYNFNARYCRRLEALEGEGVNVKPLMLRTCIRVRGPRVLNKNQVVAIIRKYK